MKVFNFLKGVKVVTKINFQLPALNYVEKKVAGEGTTSRERTKLT